MLNIIKESNKPGTILELIQSIGVPIKIQPSEVIAQFISNNNTIVIQPINKPTEYNSITFNSFLNVLVTKLNNTCDRLNITRLDRIKLTFYKQIERLYIDTNVVFDNCELNKCYNLSWAKMQCYTVPHLRINKVEPKHLIPILLAVIAKNSSNVVNISNTSLKLLSINTPVKITLPSNTLKLDLIPTQFNESALPNSNVTSFKYINIRHRSSPSTALKLHSILCHQLNRLCPKDTKTIVYKTKHISRVNKIMQTSLPGMKFLSTDVDHTLIDIDTELDNNDVIGTDVDTVKLLRSNNTHKDINLIIICTTPVSHDLIHLFNIFSDVNLNLLLITDCTLEDFSKMMTITDPSFPIYSNLSSAEVTSLSQYNITSYISNNSHVNTKKLALSNWFNANTLTSNSSSDYIVYSNDVDEPYNKRSFINQWKTTRGNNNA